MKRRAKVINLFAGPGAGKSTIAAGLFYELKLSQISCELVREFAKELTWLGQHNILQYQDYITAEQNFRQEYLMNSVDWIITDSPLLISLMYLPTDYAGKSSFVEFVLQQFDKNENINIFLERVKVYDPAGRNQTEKEAKEIDQRTKKLLDNYMYKYHTVQADRDAVKKILSLIDFAPKVI